MRKVTIKKPEAKKNQTGTHIESTHPKERFVIDVVYLNDFVSKHRYLITKVDLKKNTVGKNIKA